MKKIRRVIENRETFIIKEGFNFTETEKKEACDCIRKYLDEFESDDKIDQLDFTVYDLIPLSVDDKKNYFLYVYNYSPV